MADKVQRPIEPFTIVWQKAAYYVSIPNYDGGEVFKAEEVKALHADIIEQGRLVQIGASGESKYGAMSAGEYIEWVKTMLEGK